MEFNLPDTWKKILQSELNQPYFKKLERDVKAAYKNKKKNVFPEAENIFNALESTDPKKVHVVILGQDPYHGPSQAHGLSFSVPGGVRIPPSLKNIYKELLDDVDKPIPESGNLQYWTDQGVLLLNSTLTVEEGKPGSHQKMGWEKFTDAIISKISDQQDHVVFLLWGKFAAAKRNLIDDEKHLVLETSHPSPLSVNAGFLGSKHFSQTNDYLKANGLPEILW